MSTYKATGIILRRTDYGEADRIYTILTPDGKVSAIAKSVRKMTAKLSRHLELLCEIEFMFAKGKNLDIVTAAQTKQNFLLAEDYEALKRGFLLLEMSDKLSDIEDTSEIYSCLQQGLKSLKSQSKPVATELAFKLNLLRALGQEPRLDVAIDTQQPVMEGQSYALDYAAGGLVSAASSHPEDELSADALKFWRICLRSGIDNAARINNADDIAASSLMVCNRFYDYLYGIDFKSDQI